MAGQPQNRKVGPSDSGDDALLQGAYKVAIAMSSGKKGKKLDPLSI